MLCEHPPFRKFLADQYTFSIHTKCYDIVNAGVYAARAIARNLRFELSAYLIALSIQCV